jgi:hypothetical protein
MNGLSHGKIERTPARGWLHRLVRCWAHDAITGICSSDR